MHSLQGNNVFTSFIHAFKRYWMYRRINKLWTSSLFNFVSSIVYVSGAAYFKADCFVNELTAPPSTKKLLTPHGTNLFFRNQLSPSYLKNFTLYGNLSFITLFTGFRHCSCLSHPYFLVILKYLLTLSLHLVLCLQNVLLPAVLLENISLCFVNEWLTHYDTNIFFYCCTVHFDNTYVLITNKCTSLLHI